MKLPLVRIAFCFFVSIGCMLVLFITSGQIKDHHNSFLRDFPPHPVLEGDVIDVKFNSYYIAGGNSTTVYLANYTAPLRLLSINLKNPADTTHISINLEGSKNQKFRAPRISVDSPSFYLTDGVVPCIYKGSVNNWFARKVSSDTVFFRDIIPFGGGSFALKSLGNPVHENVLGLLKKRHQQADFVPGLLKKQIDGIFCTDGMLQYNSARGLLTYVYYYRNQFLVMDTTLKLKYSGQTIDTTSMAKISVGMIESENSHILTKPPLFVNKKNCTDGQWLFVNSNLLAKNEFNDAFRWGSVIDVYDLTDGKYRFSFYIYKYLQEKEMTDFRVFDHKMVVIYGNIIRVFELRSKFFPANSISSQ